MVPGYWLLVIGYCCCFWQELRRRDVCPQVAEMNWQREPSMTNNCWPSRGPKKILTLRATTRRPNGRSPKNALKRAKTHQPPPPYEHLVASARAIDLRIWVHLHRKKREIRPKVFVDWVWVHLHVENVWNSSEASNWRIRGSDCQIEGAHWTNPSFQGRTASRSQDSCAPSRRKPEEILPESFVDCRKHEGRCLPKEELVEVMSKFLSESARATCSQRRTAPPDPRQTSTRTTRGARGSARRSAVEPCPHLVVIEICSAKLQNLSGVKSSKTLATIWPPSTALPALPCPRTRFGAPGRRPARMWCWPPYHLRVALPMEATLQSEKKATHQRTCLAALTDTRLTPRFTSQVHPKSQDLTGYWAPAATSRGSVVAVLFLVLVAVKLLYGYILSMCFVLMC